MVAAFAAATFYMDSIAGASNRRRAVTAPALVAHQRLERGLVVPARPDLGVRLGRGSFAITFR